jgi:hypothetical protein
MTHESQLRVFDIMTIVVGSDFTLNHPQPSTVGITADFQAPGSAAQYDHDEAHRYRTDAGRLCDSIHGSFCVSDKSGGFVVDDPFYGHGANVYYGAYPVPTASLTRSCNAPA